jgi:hypothetical protein
MGLKLVQTLCFFLKDADLIGCKIIAIDGTKKEHTATKANFNQRKLRHLAYIEEQTRISSQLAKKILRIIALQLRLQKNRTIKRISTL